MEREPEQGVQNGFEGSVVTERKLKNPYMNGTPRDPSNSRGGVQKSRSRESKITANIFRQLVGYRRGVKVCRIEKTQNRKNTALQPETGLKNHFRTTETWGLKS